MEVRISRSALLGYIAGAFLLGLAIGVLLLVWQRIVLLGEVSAAQERLTLSRKGSLGAAAQITDLRTRLAASQASVAQLTKRNSTLASDLAAAQNLSGGPSQPTKPSGPVVFLSRGVSPSLVKAGKPIVLEVRLTGSPDSVKMRIVSRTDPAAYDHTFTLFKVSSSGGTQTWKRTVTAPGTPGEYRFFALAKAGLKKCEMPGVSAWTFMVE